VPLPANLPEKREPLVLFLNSFKAWRNPGIIVEAARIVLEKIPEARFDFVGSTSQFRNYSPSDKVEGALRDQIHQLGLDEQVRVLPFTNEPQKYFARASVFVLPADLIFCNNSLLESMAMGVVPVVADVEGSSLIVETGVSGFIVERDPEHFAEKIIELLKDPVLCREMSLAARRKIEIDFNSARTARNLYSLYQQELWSGNLMKS